MLGEEFKAHTLSLPVLELGETCEESDPAGNPVELRTDCEDYLYFTKLLISPFSKTRHRELYRWNGFPSVLNKDGSPWLDANLYLLDAAECPRGWWALISLTYSSAAGAAISWGSVSPHCASSSHVR